MPARPSDGAWTCALLQLLRLEPLGIPQADLPARLGEELGELIEPGETFDRWLSRALEDLESLGEDTVRQDTESGDRRIVLLKGRPAATRRRMPLGPELASVRMQILRLLDELVPDRELIDFPSLVKEHIPRNLVEFAYGGEGTRVVGVPYRLRGSRMLVETDEGCFSYETSAIRDLRLKERRTTEVQGSQRPRAVEPTPFAGPSDPDRFHRSRGRPDSVRSVLLAGRMAVLIRSRARAGEDPEIREMPVDRIAADLGVSRSEALSKAEAINRMDPAIWLEDEDDRFCVGDEATVAAGDQLDGADALLARRELGAVLALGGAERDFGLAVEPARLEDYRSKLDVFLDRVDLDDEHCPSAKAVIAAIDKEDALLARVDGSLAPQTLRPQGLRLRGGRWYITGELDGREIPEPGLGLARVTAAAPTDGPA